VRVAWTKAAVLGAAAAAAVACGGGGGSGPAGPAGGAPAPGGGGPAAPAGAHGWVLVASEDFEGGALPAGAFAPDPVPDDGPFADAGVYFTRQGIRPPAAFRATQPFGAGGWLTLEAYTRRADRPTSDLASVVPDPAGGPNHVLRISPRDHTDAAVVRPTAPLPARYRVSLRVGFPSFGDGAGLNGYSGGETPEPWESGDATRQNGFYWLAILDALPRPHNNVWIHHHRKVVVDTDNHYPAWMEVWDGSRFVWSGVHPIMMFALDGTSPGDEQTGNPFLSWAADAWQPAGKIRAVDRYLPGEWYRLVVERDGARYTIELSGRFAAGGERTYRATVDAEAACVWHWPTDADEAARAARCVDEGAFATTSPADHRWPAGGAWPDWFMFGDPHENFYEGEVHFDDVRLEVWKD
jgi:hypothetical protein